MNKYLEKIASKVEKNDHHVLKGLAGGAGAFVGGVAASNASALPLIREIAQHHRFSQGALKKVMRDNKDLNVTFSPHKAMKRATQEHKDTFVKGLDKAGPHYASEDYMKQVGGGHKAYVHNKYSGREVKNHTVLMHELGHARDKAILKAKNSKAVKGLGAAGLVARRLHLGTIAGTGMLASEKYKDKAWIAPLVGSLHHIRSEAAANYHGHKIVSKHVPHMKGKFGRLAALNTLNALAMPITQSAILHHLGHKKDKHE